MSGLRHREVQHDESDDYSFDESDDAFVNENPEDEDDDVIFGDDEEDDEMISQEEDPGDDISEDLDTPDRHSLALWLNSRLINNTTQFQLLSAKDRELLKTTINHFEIVDSDLRITQVKETRNVILLFGSLVIFYFGGCVLWPKFLSLEHLEVAALDKKATAEDGYNGIMYGICVIAFASLCVFLLVYIGSIVVTCYCYFRMKYLVRTVLANLEHSHLCVRNAVQYLSDFTAVTAGYKFSHKASMSGIRTSAIDKNPGLFQALSELLILDIISTQDSCSKIDDDSNFLNVHICKTLELDSVVTALQQVQGEDANSKIRTITSLHYEMTAEFVFSLILNLANSFAEGNKPACTELVSVMKCFVANYDTGLTDNLEKQLDQLHECLTVSHDGEMSGSGDSQSNVTPGVPRANDLRSCVTNIESANRKSVLNSLRIHLNEVAQMTSSGDSAALSDESLEMSRQRLQSALMCLDHLERLKGNSGRGSSQGQVPWTGPVQPAGPEDGREGIVFPSEVQPDEQIFQDEVFIGESLGPSPSSAPHEDPLDPLTSTRAQQPPEFMEAQQQVLSELGDVISHKALERRGREEAAIVRKYGDHAPQGFEQQEFGVANGHNGVTNNGYVSQEPTSFGDEEDNTDEPSSFSPDLRSELMSQLSSRLGGHTPPGVLPPPRPGMLHEEVFGGDSDSADDQFGHHPAVSANTRDVLALPV